MDFSIGIPFSVSFVGALLCQQRNRAQRRASVVRQTMERLRPNDEQVQDHLSVITPEATEADHLSMISEEPDHVSVITEEPDHISVITDDDAMSVAELTAGNVALHEACSA